MREFFHGWRRKAGCVLLVMASLLTACWLRSMRVGDSVEFLLAGHHHFLISSNGKLAWFAFESESGSFSYLGICSFPKEGDRVHWGCLPSIEESTIMMLDSNRNGPDFRVIAYHLTVLPLTLLSASLILWKPRKRAAP